METRQIHVRDLSTVTGIQQYEHCVQSIFFLGLEDFEGTIYLSIESDKFSEDVALTNNTFIIGQPMTKFNVTYTCQIYGIVGTGEKIQLSKQFRMVIYKSNNISGEAGEYPIDPNLVNGIDEYVTQKESQIDDYVEQVIESIPSDYTELNDEVDDLRDDLTALEQHGYPMASISDAVDAWALQHEKDIVNQYVTPEMYGAKGDGVTDDSTAINSALASGKAVYFAKKTYLVSHPLTVSSDCVIIGNGATITEDMATKLNTGYVVLTASNCKVTIRDLSIVGDWDNQQGRTRDNKVIAIELQYCDSNLNGIRIDGFLSKCINVRGGTGTFNNIVMKNCGFTDETASFVYLSYNPVTEWSNIIAVQEEENASDSFQVFYHSTGNTKVTNFYAHSVFEPFNARNGSFELTNAYFYNTGGINANTSGDAEGSDAFISNVIFDQVKPYNFGGYTSLIGFSALKNWTIKDCIMRISDGIQTGGINYLMRFRPSPCESITIDNLKIYGDSKINNGLYVNLTPAVDIVMKNCRFPVLNSSSAYAGSVYDTNLARFILDNVEFKNKTNRLMFYSSASQGAYENVVVHSALKQRGATADRPTPWYHEVATYYDTTVSKFYVWNGTAWVAQDYYTKSEIDAMLVDGDEVSY